MENIGLAKKANIFRVLNSDRIKFFSVKVNWIIILGLFIGSILLTFLTTLLYRGIVVEEIGAAVKENPNLISFETAGNYFYQIVDGAEQLVFVILTLIGANNVANEFTTDTISVSVSIIQKRSIFYNAKIIFYGVLVFATTFIVNTVLVLETYLLTDNIITCKGSFLDFYMYGFGFSTIGKSVCFMLFAIIVMSLVFILKSYATATMIHIIFNFGISNILLFMLGNSGNKIISILIQILPYNAMTNIIAGGNATFTFDTNVTVSVIILLAWTILFYILGIIIFRKKDL